MSWRNPYALGNIALGCDGCYNVGSHGCASATYESIINADIPKYAHGFYSPTEHEALSELKYSRTEIGYDKSLREIKRAIEGAPLEAYAPSPAFVDDSGSAIPKTEVIEPIVIKNPRKEIVDEIIKAQKEATGKEIVLQELEIKEIIIKRRIRKREIKVSDKKEQKDLLLSKDIS
ncbi:hypothetical protein KY366_02270 [Candidatus Woesearchaeota archaeon]|nr:hypothetical protein [Candidatus Woesearchaeota archaeon]